MNDPTFEVNEFLRELSSDDLNKIVHLQCGDMSPEVTKKLGIKLENVLSTQVTISPKKKIDYVWDDKGHRLKAEDYVKPKSPIKVKKNETVHERVLRFQKLLDR